MTFTPDKWVQVVTAPLQEPSLYTVKAVLILDNDGDRLYAKVRWYQLSEPSHSNTVLCIIADGKVSSVVGVCSTLWAHLVISFCPLPNKWSLVGNYKPTVCCRRLYTDRLLSGYLYIYIFFWQLKHLRLLHSKANMWKWV